MCGLGNRLWNAKARALCNLGMSSAVGRVCRMACVFTRYRKPADASRNGRMVMQIDGRRPESSFEAKAMLLWLCPKRPPIRQLAFYSPVEALALRKISKGYANADLHAGSTVSPRVATRRPA